MVGAVSTNGLGTSRILPSSVDFADVLGSIGAVVLDPAADYDLEEDDEREGVDDDRAVVAEGIRSGEGQAIHIS